MRSAVSIFVLTVLVSAAAIAAVLPDPSIYWTGALSTSGTTACVKASSGSSLCALFHAGSESGVQKNWTTTKIYASAAGAVCCWSLTPAADIDPANLEVAADNKGPCFRVPAEPARETPRPVYSDLFVGGGSTTGICSEGTSVWDDGATGDVNMIPPCTVATGSPGDCDANHNLDEATCVAKASASSDMLKNVSAYLNCEAASGTPTVYVHKERFLNFSY